MSSRILVVKAIDVSHEKKVVSLNHGCCDGGEGIIVPKFDFLEQ